jgi:hypothetical protein
MDDINRLLIFLLLIGLLYALYRYQHIIFGQQNKNINILDNQTISNVEEPYVSIDNISQLSMGSLDDENGNPDFVYKPDSILGSLDTNSLFQSEDGSMLSNGSLASNNSFFF